VTDIPWDKLGIPAPLRDACAPNAPLPLRTAAARGALPATTDALLGALYVLLGDPEESVRDTASATLRGLPNPAEGLSQRTHPKVLEALAQLRAEPALDERILLIRATNDRTAALIARRAAAGLCAIIADNHERLLMTPDVVVALHQNEACTDVVLERAVSFLRMNGCLPTLPASRGGDTAVPSQPASGAEGGPPPSATPPPTASTVDAFDLDAEIDAALAGLPSPMLARQQARTALFDLDSLGAPGTLQGFTFDFREDMDFGSDLTEESAEEAPPEKKLSLEQKIREMTVGQKIKLAYLGNKDARALLIRDRSKQVPLAVLKSGRVTENESLSFASNRSLSTDVIRELSNNREWMRNHAFQVALANNPKCPPGISLGLVPHMTPKELAALARNKNVSTTVSALAAKLLRTKGK
jgi:hypothetical protein